MINREINKKVVLAILSISTISNSSLLNDSNFFIIDYILKVILIFVRMYISFRHIENNLLSPQECLNYIQMSEEEGFEESLIQTISGQEIGTKLFNI